MAKVRKVPYYTIGSSVFHGKVWKKHDGSRGAVPINTPQKISYDRLAPGEAPPPPPTRPTANQSKSRQAEADKYKQLAKQSAKQHPKEPPKPQSDDAENHAAIPEFDLQDVPDAMDKMGWPIAATIARKWFTGPSHVYNDKADGEQPLDDTTVTIDWALKYGKVQERLNELVSADIRSEKALALIRHKVTEHVTKTFTGTKSTNPNLGFETAVINSDIRQFHIDWQIQRKMVDIFDTLDRLTLTDLSATLGNFILYAAIGKVEISKEKFFKYDRKPAEYCIDSVAKLTHIYVYLKDNYSFNDVDHSNSQYLGHWNRSGMVTSYILAANDLLGQIRPGWKMRLDHNDKLEKKEINWDYLSIGKEIDKPVDTRRRFFRKLFKKDVYWPVYNRTYNEWRAKHKRGEDFMIYSKPELRKLKTPIVIKLETICRPYFSTATGR
ncbi:hypothetical protein C0Z18_19760 [Trinickia dabaoshanensis]|uniref:Uncharacterized protein n=1 Tax=Trinickia dabaoshanensis TaxID=564714 RepID=A0A2N7VKK1_9BURK|nr:DUF6402 family protein [Trinickia dabaoshanensis]PMS17690.1 hypothetical protein C0Z18_19760 [Trinickia dabaoshanensis]